MLVESLVAISALFAQPTPDTLRIAHRAVPPSFDGFASEVEYGAPSLTLRTASGPAPVWLSRAGDCVYVAARFRDSLPYWGDDFVLVLDPDGSAGARPSEGDRGWVVRRTLDSSVVYSAQPSGRWEPPGGARSLGSVRAGEGWAVRTHTDSTGWSLELRLDARLFAGEPSTGRLARLAIRSYADGLPPEQALSTWPGVPPGSRVQLLERTPDLWIPVRLQ